MKIGQQVYLRVSTDEPKATGTVTRLGPRGSFQVKYHKTPTRPSGRFWYPAERARAFGRLGSA